jgi:hypothetical protein
MKKILESIVFFCTRGISKEMTWNVNKVLLIIVLILCCDELKAQVSIYDPACYPVTQSQLVGTTGTFYSPSALFGNGQVYNFNGASNESVIARSEIKIIGNATGQTFYAGNYTTGGQFQLSIAPKANIDVAVMNYSNLNNVLRYEKLELGVALPADILLKVNNFVNEATVPDNQKLNPFLDWKLKVQATFQYSNGLTKTVDAFYYREMAQSGEGWVDLGTNYPFRVRVSPPNNGNCTCTIKIFENNVLKHTSDSFPFNVIESGSHGFVKAHANTRNLELDGQIIFPFGVNLPAPEVGQFMQWSYDKDDQISNKVWNEYHSDVLKFGLQGGKYARILMVNWSNGLEFEKLGNYYDRLNYAWELDKTIKTFEDYDVFINFNMMDWHELTRLGTQDEGQWDFTDDTPKGNPIYYYYQENTTNIDGSFHAKGDPCLDWDGSHYKKINNRRNTYQQNFGFDRFSNIITNETSLVDNKKALDYLKQRYRYMISRWGYSTNIYIFELMSESWHMDEELAQHLPTSVGAVKPYETPTHPNFGSVTSSVKKFNSELSTFIKTNLGHTEHLLGACGYEIGGMGNDNSITLPNIDVLVISRYAGGYPDGEYTSAAAVALTRQIAYKPILVSEGGYGEFDPCSNNWAEKIHMGRYGFMGFAGYHLWDTYLHYKEGLSDNPSQDDKRRKWPQIILTQQTMEGINCLPYINASNGGYSSEKGETFNVGLFGKRFPQKEFQSYIAGDATGAVGYIYNRTFNEYSMRSNNVQNECLALLGDEKYYHLRNFANVQNNDGNAYLSSLTNGHTYYVQYFNAITGQLISANNQVASNNGLFLEHPDLNSNQPMIWFTAKFVPNKNSIFIDSAIINKGVEISIESSENISLFPNPGNDLLYIKIGNLDENTTIEIKIIDETGRILIDRNVSSEETQINTSNLTSGIYYIKILSNSEIIKFQKWVKMNE